MTPFLWLVVTGYAVFVIVLGGVSAWTWLPARAARTTADRGRAAAQAGPNRAGAT